MFGQDFEQLDRHQNNNHHIFSTIFSTKRAKKLKNCKCTLWADMDTAQSLIWWKVKLDKQGFACERLPIEFCRDPCFDEQNKTGKTNTTSSKDNGGESLNRSSTVKSA